MKKKNINKNKKSKKENKFNKALKIILKIFGYAFGTVASIIILFFIYINLPVAPSKDNSQQVGVTFSSRYASDININWKEAYVAMLDDLKVRYIRIPVYWDLVEKSDGVYDFADLDWQLLEAQKRNAHIILAMGQKVPRWPECFVPKWVGENRDKKKKELLEFEKVVVERYKIGHPEIARWQIENEPFLDFGLCPEPFPDADLLDSEIAQVKKMDSSRPIVVTDSGELSLWVKAASRADVFGTTMYREVYSATMGHWRYPIGPNFFKAKQFLIKLFADQNSAIAIELQGEPWVGGWTVHAPIETQLASMNAEVLKDNIEFAKKTGMKEIYVWGVEWWYWMKTTQNNPTLWNMAKTFTQK